MRPTHPGLGLSDEEPRPRCKMRGCRRVITLREAQMGVCWEHALVIWEQVQRNRHESDVIEAAEKRVEQRRKQDLLLFARKYQSALPSIPVPEPDASPRPVRVSEYIYYVKVDSLIKVGYSASLYERLMSYGPAAEVLAHHPGTRADERDLHRTFRPFLAHGREWYNPSQLLIDHIDAVIAKWGKPWIIPEWSTPKEPPLRPHRSSK